MSAEKFIPKYLEGESTELIAPASSKLKSVKRSSQKQQLQKTKQPIVSKESEEDQLPLLLHIKSEPDSYEDTIEEVIQSSMLVANPQIVKAEAPDQPEQARGVGKRLLVRNPVAKRGRNARLRRTAELKTETGKLNITNV